MRFSDSLKKFLLKTKGQLLIIAILLVLVLVVTLLTGIVLTSAQMLQSLIQAESTILGFLAVLAAYSLTSYDSRIDRFEQQWFDLTLADHTKTAEEVEKRINGIRKRKKETITGITLASVSLIVSLILSIVLLGIINNTILMVLNSVAFLSLGFFFMSIVLIIVHFYQMSYEAEIL